VIARFEVVGVRVFARAVQQTKHDAAGEKHGNNYQDDNDDFG
jgi:hypothetical protein